MLLLDVYFASLAQGGNQGLFGSDKRNKKQESIKHLKAQIKRLIPELEHWKGVAQDLMRKRGSEADECSPKTREQRPEFLHKDVAHLLLGLASPSASVKDELEQDDMAWNAKDIAHCHSNIANAT